MGKELKVPQFQQDRAKSKSPLYGMIHNDRQRETVRTCFIFDKEKYSKIKVYAAQHGTTVTDLVKAYFDDLLSKNNADGQQ